jgi:hypothetical protein
MGILKGDRGSKGKRSAPGSIHRLQTRTTWSWGSFDESMVCWKWDMPPSNRSYKEHDDIMVILPVNFKEP